MATIEVHITVKVIGGEHLTRNGSDPIGHQFAYRKAVSDNPRHYAQEVRDAIDDAGAKASSTFVVRAATEV